MLSDDSVFVSDMMRDGDIMTSLLGGSLHRKWFKKRFLARCPDIYHACAGIELKMGSSWRKDFAVAQMARRTLFCFKTF